MLFLENMMNLFKKKPEISARETFLNMLNADSIDKSKATHLFLIADANIVRHTEEFNRINDVRRIFHEEIGKSKQGKVWFKQEFEKFIKHLRTMKVVDAELIKLDSYLSLYWYLVIQYPLFMEPVIAMCKDNMDPRIRRHYEKTYNIDIFTGQVFDIEVELNNAWKEHFYKASFAFHEGKGNLDISIQEWRIFVKEFVDQLSKRPRLVYDFAKEIVAYQKLFNFFSYVVRIERMNQKLIKLQDESTYIDSLIDKIINAVYAVSETHGMILKRLYV